MLSWFDMQLHGICRPNTCWEREGDENNGGAGFEQVRPANHRKDSSSVLRKTG